MIFVLSPAKTLNMDFDNSPVPAQLPKHQQKAEELVTILRSYSAVGLSKLMAISKPLAELNVERYRNWSTSPDVNSTKAALYAFNGDVYEGLSANTMGVPARSYLHSKLRILSGLYGTLNPLDALQPYRLEMGTTLVNSKGKNLYSFWRETVTTDLENELTLVGSDTLVNLASEEYFKVVDTKALGRTIITPIFEDHSQGKFKVVSFYAKRARGLMLRFAAENAIKNSEDLKAFDIDGYRFVEDASTAYKWIFRRALD